MAAIVRPSTSTPFLLFLIAQLLPASADKPRVISHAATRSAISKTTLVRRCCRRGLLGLNTVVDNFPSGRHRDFALMREVHIGRAVFRLRADDGELVAGLERGLGPAVNATQCGGAYK